MAAELEEGFTCPPAENRPLAWWHWINGNISKEGIRADLKDMKRVGLAGCQMLDVSGYTPPGSVRYGSEAWYEHVNYAIQTANELGLKIELMNCPGWSTSGGPWVTPEQSMKELTWIETDVAGGAIDLRLSEPPKHEEYYRDIAILAVPADPASDGIKPEVSANAKDVDAKSLAAGSKKPVKWPEDAPNPVVTFRYPKPVQRQLLKITYTSKTQVNCQGTIEASQDGTNFRKVKDFDFNGGLRDTPAILIAFPTTTASVFRVSLQAGPGHRPWPLQLGEVSLSNLVRTENFSGKIVETTIASVVPGEPPSNERVGAIPANSTTDLTGQMSPDGTLTATLPEGRWTILRIGYTSTGVRNHPAQPEGTGLEVDKMESAFVRDHLEKSLGRILKEAGPMVGKTLNGLLIDSWEAGQQNWTADFPRKFATRRGYDLRPFLPALTGRVVNSPAETDAFLTDFRRTICDLIAEEYFGTVRRYADEHGLKLYGESYTGHCFNEIQAGANVDVNMAEFWAKDGGGEISRVKRSASMANTMGRTLVAAESFTACGSDGRWQQVPSNLKAIGDRAFSSGLNQVVLHSYVHQPRSDIAPGFTLGGCGSHFGRLNTWWPLAGGWISYLSRCQYLLQRGTHVADFLKLRPYDVDILVSPTSPAEPGGYDFDYIGEMQLIAASASSGKITLPGGVEYRALLLPERWVASLPLLQCLQKLSAMGVPIYGSPPVTPGGLADLRDGGKVWSDLVQSLWYTEPKVRPLAEVKDFEKTSAIPPDFQIGHFEGESDLTWIHRRNDDGDFYFMANSGDERHDFTAQFRMTGRQPELWNAMTGRVEKISLFETTKTFTKVPLSLAPGESAIIFFREALPPRWITAVQSDGRKKLFLGRDVSLQGDALVFSKSGEYRVLFNDGTEQVMKVPQLSGVTIGRLWQLEFQPPNRAAFTRTFEGLSSWSESTDTSVRYFSGMGTYRTEVDIPEDMVRANLRAILDLGEVCDLAGVQINGRDAGILWAPPFVVEVSKLLKPGKNMLEIRVADRWINRLIGDEQLPADVEYKKPEGVAQFMAGGVARFPDWFNDREKVKQRARVSFPMWRFYDAKAPLVDAGLIGPVSLRFEQVVPLAARAE